MTIKKRLLLSNFIMIIVPVIITSIVGSVCVGFIFNVLKHGGKFGLKNSGEFYLASQTAAEFAEEKNIIKNR